MSWFAPCTDRNCSFLPRSPLPRLFLRHNVVLLLGLLVLLALLVIQSMTLAEFAEYFETCTKPGQAILNMISLEFRFALWERS